MKKTTLIAAIFSIFYLQSQVSTTPQNKKVVLEMFGGHRALFDPSGHKVANLIKQNNPNNVYIINIHSGSYSTQSSPYYYTSVGDTIHASTGIVGYPMASLNRRNNPWTINRNLWSSTADLIMNENSPVNLFVKTSINKSTRVLTTEVEVYYTSNGPGSFNKLTLALLQNNVLGPQKGLDSNPSQKKDSIIYIHNHMLRMHLTSSAWGERLDTITAGKYYKKIYTTTLPNMINNIPLDLDNIEVVGFVSEANNNILSAHGASSQSSQNNPCDTTTYSVISTIPGIYPTACNPAVISSCYPNPFSTLGQGQSSSNRIIYKASELIASGLTAGNIKQLEFNITFLANPSINNYEIKIAHTSTADVKVSGISFNNFYGPKPITLHGGWNSFNSDSGFNWDGVSNIIIEINSTTNYAMTSSNQFLTLFNNVSGMEVGFKYSDTIGVYGSNISKPYSIAGATSSKPAIRFRKCINSSNSSNPLCNINANYSWTALSNAGSYQFQDLTTPLSPSYTYLWHFGDTTFSFNKNPSKIYSSTGAKQICLFVTKYSNANNIICYDTACKTINVTSINPCNRLLPEYTFNTSANGSYQFTNTTNLTGFNIVSILYNFSDGAFYNFNNPSHTFNKNGIYSVTMTITVHNTSTGTNCTKSITKQIYVTNSVCGCTKAGFTYTKSGKTINFNNTTSCIDTNTSILYKFENGVTSSLTNPSYTYPLPGIYKVTLIVTKMVGTKTCIDSVNQYIQINTSNQCKDSGYQFPYTCSNYFSPVCGCDSVTYFNSCFATKAGVKQYSMGPCPNDTNYVKICGYVVFDKNLNCSLDSPDIKLKGVSIKINSTPVQYAYTDNNGYYSIYLPKGTYNLSQVLTGSNLHLTQICPASNASITVSANIGGMTYCNNNFYDSTNTCQDLAVSIYRSWNITPGFTSLKTISYQNKGATPINSVVLKYRFLSGLAVKSSTSATYSVSGNIITWNLGTIPPYSSGIKSAYFSVPITGISLGTTVIDSVWIEPSVGDCNLSNNSATYIDTCVGSWDPNDKTAFPANDISPEVKKLDYLIRFQNTGNAPAHNVVIEDQILENFDISSLSIVGNSHPMTHYYNDDGKLYFEFENIMLPDSNTDFDASQGYVMYSINLKEGLSIGTQLKNTAHIFFDFNDAVVTNTTVNTIVIKSSVGIKDKGMDFSISIFPNPTSNIIQLSISPLNASQISYELFDLSGKTIVENESKKLIMGDYHKELNLEKLNKGIYILQVNIDGVKKSYKIVKE